MATKPNVNTPWTIGADHGPGPRLADRNLVPLLPHIFNDFNCPACGAHAPEASRPLFIGIQILADHTCSACGTRFLRDLPVGFQVDLPLSFTPDDRRILEPFAEPWITYPEYRLPTSHQFPIERRVFRECRKVIILNTLDHLYGHVLLKLYNAQDYIDRYPDHGLVIILPRMFEWLIPKGTAEVWLVDQKLSQARAWHPCIDAFVQQQLPRYDEVHLSRAWGHPDFSRIDIERFTGIAPMPLEAFTSLPPHITFVARTDRLWFASPLGKFCYRALNPLGLRKSLGRWFIHRQTTLIRRVMRGIQRRIPDVTFSVVGLAPAGGFDGLAQDLRTTRMDREVELVWCRAYAKSQLVVGVHGSNMLLPTAFAAGLIEILPHDRLGNMGQDVSVRWNDRMQLFLYRFVDEFATPSQVTMHAVSMLKDLTLYRRNNRANIFDPTDRK